MGSLADYAENKLLDLIFGAVAFSAPATVYVGLSTTAIADAGTGITEPVGNNYSRAAVTNNTTNFPSAVGGAKSNGADFTFPTPSGNWGTITDFFISDGSSGGNILGVGTLAASQSPQSGNVVKFAAGSLTFSLT